MVVIYVGDILPVTQITRFNNKAWEKLGQEVNKYNEDVMLDFEGIELIEPWLNEEFKRFMADSRIHIKVYSSENIKETIDVMCEIGGYKTGRVINEDEFITSVKPKNAVDERLQAMKNRFRNACEIEESNNNVTLNINVSDAVDQLSSDKTIMAIEEVINEYHQENSNINKAKLNIESMFIQQNIMEMLCKVMDRLMQLGIEMCVVSDDIETTEKLMTYKLVNSHKSITEEFKIKCFNEIEPLTVGMLTKYKETRGTDAFGRCGNGKPVLCRPAIYLGLGNDNGVVVAQFREYRYNTFCTREHYAVAHDNDVHPGLEVVNTKVPLSRIGLADLFIGSLYHFNAAIQYGDSEDDYNIVHKVNEDGTVKTYKMLLPEYIKCVFDDFGVEYNKDELNKVIEENRKMFE